MLIRRCGLVGNPAGHSLSPAIHRAGYLSLGLSWEYESYTVDPDSLARFVSSCRADSSWVGLSVTAPHKEAICEFGECEPLVRLTGAGNTLLFGEEGVRVYNTDVSGFIRAWRAHGLETLGRAAIVGNGATARSIAVALSGLGVREIVVLARDPVRAAGLVQLGNSLGVTVEVAGFDEKSGGLDLLASTVPGRAALPHVTEWAAAAKVIFDVVYDPWPTPLGEAAVAGGRLSLNGLDLLAGQAVDQFELFTGRRVSFEECRLAAERELSNRVRR